MPHRHQSKINVFLGVAFEIEKPLQRIIRSFYGVLTAPVEPRFRNNLIVRR